MSAMSPRALLIFLGTLLAAAWSIQTAAILITGGPDGEGAAVFMLATMFTPTLWAIGYLTLFNRKAWRGVPIRFPNPLWLAFAAIAPAAFGMAIVAAALKLGIAQPGFFDFSNGAQIVDGPWLLGDGAQPWLLFAANLSVTAAAYAGISSLAAVGEEFGWRGVIQQHLIARLGVLKGVTVLALVWAAWHLPMLLTGYNYPEYPVIGALALFPATLLGGSFILAWLTIESRSLWPAVIFHGSVNGMFQGVVNDLEMVEGLSRLWLDAGWTAGYLAIGLILIAIVRFARGPDAGALGAT